jgi:hypothetical protein
MVNRFVSTSAPFGDNYDRQEASSNHLLQAPDETLHQLMYNAIFRIWSKGRDLQELARPICDVGEETPVRRFTTAHTITLRNNKDDVV